MTAVQTLLLLLATLPAAVQALRRRPLPGGLLLALVPVGALAAVPGGWAAVGSHALAALAALALLILLWLAGLAGPGDVKLAAALGAILGWRGLWPALLGAAAVGFVWALGRLLWRRQVPAAALLAGSLWHDLRRGVGIGAQVRQVLPGRLPLAVALALGALLSVLWLALSTR